MLYDFVVFLDTDWEVTDQKNRQHFLIAEMARQLEGQSKILGVERPICPLTGPFRMREKFIQRLQGKRGLRRAGVNLHIYTPFVLVHNLIAAKVPGVTLLNRRLLRMLLKQVLKKLDFRADNLISWIHHPYQLEDIGLLNEQFLVYDCYDDYTTSEQNATLRRDLERRERTILERANCVLVASAELLNARRKTGNVHLVPNGVEFEHFARIREMESTTSIRSSPILGFTGKISPRLDFRLLTRLAVKHPNWTLMMIGPMENNRQLGRNPDYRVFAAAPNVLFLGSKPYGALPIYMRPFDICLLPYTANDPVNVSCSPLKLYEYLSTGMPIVSTDLPAVRPFNGLVRIARDATDFEQYVAESLQETDESLPQRRLAAARENSWERRVKQILQIVDSTLKERCP